MRHYRRQLHMKFSVSIGKLYYPFFISLRYVAHQLHQKASDLKRRNQESYLSLEQMLQGKKRKTSARFFYETLVQLLCCYLIIKSRNISLFVPFFGYFSMVPRPHNYNVKPSKTRNICVQYLLMTVQIAVQSSYYYV